MQLLWNHTFVALLPLAGIFAACGGGSSTVSPPVAAAASADFVFTISTSSISINQGDVTSPVIFSVTPKNSFDANVQITLTGLPAGVAANPASPFAISPGNNVSVVFDASTSASAGSFNISAQAVSGAFSHSASLALAVVASNLPPLARTGFVRTDATWAADNPPGEPHRRHIIYDAGHKNIFVANHTVNRLEVLSVVDRSLVSEIAIPGITSADISTDGATIWVGTSVNAIVAVDAASLSVKRVYVEGGLSPLPSAAFDRPVEVLSLANEKCLVRLRQSTSSQSLLALWDPVADVFTNLTSVAPQLFQNGAGVIARSGDQTKIIVAANGSSGTIAVFDVNGALLAGPHSVGTGSFTSTAANFDGTRFAAAFTSSASSQVLLFDASLALLPAYTSASIHGMAFSRDGNFIYVSESFLGQPVITILDGHDAHVVGQVPDISVQGIPSEIEDVDESQLIFAESNRGISFIDAAAPVTLSNIAPSFGAAPAITPSQGASTGGTPFVLFGQNLPSDALIKIGTHVATNVNVANSTGIQATTPANAKNETVDVTLYSAATNWLTLAPDAFSYGPRILSVLPNTGNNNGGDTIQIFGYGFGSDPGALTVKIAGSNAIVKSVDNLPGLSPSLGLDVTYPFSLERITLQTPPGLPGTADIIVTASSGSASSTRAFQYLHSAQSYSKPGFYRFLTYDQKRQRVYLSNIDHVDVFDLSSSAFLAPIQPPGGPPPNAGLRGLAMTGGGTQLLVADFGAQSVYQFNPDNGSGTITHVGGVPGFASSGPSLVAATSIQTVFVGLSGVGSAGAACPSCLAQMNVAVSPPTVQPVPQPEVSAIVGAPLLHGNSAGDHVFLAFASGAGGQLATWNAAAPNQFLVSPVGVSVNDIAPAADGNVFALQSNSSTEVRNSAMLLTAVPAAAELTQIPGRQPVPGLAVHPSGALIYQPFLTGVAGAPGVKGGVDIVDAHSGELRLRIVLPQQLMTDVDALHGGFLAIDESGQRLFAITTLDGSPQQASLSVVQLAAVPLGIGSVTPANIAVAGGTSVNIRGSGFLAGVKVTIGGKTATATLIDMNTLTVSAPALVAGSQQLVITNANGETVSLDGAVAAN